MAGSKIFAAHDLNHDFGLMGMIHLKGLLKANLENGMFVEYKYGDITERIIKAAMKI